jgi:hypothetical protein
MATELKFAGLTDAQVLCLFERIASTSNLLAEMCREKAEEFGGDDCGGQVFSDTSIDCCFADSRSKALGDKFPSVECNRMQL